MSVCLLIHTVFLQHLRLSAKVSSKDTEFTLPSAFTNTMPPPLLPSCTTVTHLLQSVNQHWHIIISQSLWFTFGFILDIVYSIDFDKCIMTYVHNFYIIHYSFTALEFLCTLPIPSQPTSELLATIDFITIVLLFSEGRILRIIQYEAFADCLFSLSNVLSIFST